MTIEKSIKFDKDNSIYFDYPLYLKNFTIKSNNIMYYNILVNYQDLINFIDYEDADEYFNEENLEYSIPLSLNCIKTEYDKVDGYYNNFKFLKEIYIESISIENKDPDFNMLPDIYLEYDNYDDNIICIEEVPENDDVLFKNIYFKFYDKENDDNKEIVLYEIYIIEDKNRKIKLRKMEQDEYKFKHIKDSTYCISFEEKQKKNIDTYYKFNCINYITSFYPII